MVRAGPGSDRPQGARRSLASRPHGLSRAGAGSASWPKRRPGPELSPWSEPRPAWIVLAVRGVLRQGALTGWAALGPGRPHGLSRPPARDVPAPRAAPSGTRAAGAEPRPARAGFMARAAPGACAVPVAPARPARIVLTVRAPPA